jgi:hypothetical protein
VEQPKVIARFEHVGSWGANRFLMLIYEDGEVMFRPEITGKFFHGTIRSEEMQSFRKFCTALEKSAGLKEHYELSVVSDQSQTTYTIPFTYSPCQFSVSGLSRKAPYVTTEEFATDKRNWPPATLLRLHHWFCQVKPQQVETWSAKDCRVLLSPAEVQQPALEWQADWPDLSSPQSYTYDEVHAIYLTEEIAEQARHTLQGSEFVKLGGATYRFRLQPTLMDDPSLQAAVPDAD